MDTGIIFGIYASIGLIVALYIMHVMGRLDRFVSTPVLVIVVLLWPIAGARMIYTYRKIKRLREERQKSN